MNRYLLPENVIAASRPLSNLSPVQRGQQTLSILFRGENNIATRMIVVQKRAERTAERTVYEHRQRKHRGTVHMFHLRNSTFINAASFRLISEPALSSAFYSGDLYARKRDNFEILISTACELRGKMLAYLGRVELQQEKSCLERRKHPCAERVYWKFRINYEPRCTRRFSF